MGLQRWKILASGCWITYHQNQKWLTKCLSPLNRKLKKIMKREILCSNQCSPNLLLKNFAIQHRIKEWNRYDPESFLLNSKQPITILMINTRQTKVKLILSCKMEKGDLKSGEVIAKETAFHSKTEVNFESTDSNERLSKMKETVLESLGKFKRKQINWRFHSVLSLHLHTVKYVPLCGSSYIPLLKFLAAKKAIINLNN